VRDGVRGHPPRQNCRSVRSASAIILLRQVADERDHWADEQARLTGEHTVLGPRYEAVGLRTAANILESGNVLGGPFSYQAQ
jgi:hypothetical protein